MDLPRIIAGDTLSFSSRVRGYEASAGWTLKYRLIPRTGEGEAIAFDSAPAADGQAHQVSVSAETTAEWPTGEYSWAAYVETDAGASHTWRTGSIKVLPDPRTSDAPLDLRTDAEIALAQARAAFAAWNPTRRSYTIGDRSMTFGSKAEIVQTVQYWEMEVQRERRAARLRAGLSDPRKLRVRLGRG